jgi:hypothetical protein
MSSYTGTVKSIALQGLGDCFPLVNPFNNYRNPGEYRNRRVYTAELMGYSALGTDDYTFSLFIADRALEVDACFVVDPVGLEPQASNHNNFTLRNATDSVTLCAQDTTYGIVANEPFEITRANTVANRTLAAGEEVTLVIDGDASGSAINYNTRVFVVCKYA